MNSIDPLSSSLYFSAVTNASKEATKGKKVEKSNKTSFSSMVKKSQEVEELLSFGLPIEIAGMEIEEAVAFLKDSVDSAADKLSSEINAENFADFRMAVTNFVKYISKNNFEIDKTKRFGMTKKSTVYFSEKRPKDPYVQLRVVDEKLNELATMVLQNYNDKIQMLAKVDEIKGLLVDFFAA